MKLMKFVLGTCLIQIMSCSILMRTHDTDLVPESKKLQINLPELSGSNVHYKISTLGPLNSKIQIDSPYHTVNRAYQPQYFNPTHQIVHPIQPPIRKQMVQPARKAVNTQMSFRPQKFAQNHQIIKQAAVQRPIVTQRPIAQYRQAPSRAGAVRVSNSIANFLPRNYAGKPVVFRRMQDDETQVDPIQEGASTSDNMENTVANNDDLGAVSGEQSINEPGVVSEEEIQNMDAQAAAESGADQNQEQGGSSDENADVQLTNTQNSEPPSEETTDPSVSENQEVPNDNLDQTNVNVDIQTSEDGPEPENEFVHNDPGTVSDDGFVHEDSSHEYDTVSQPAEVQQGSAVSQDEQNYHATVPEYVADTSTINNSKSLVGSNTYENIPTLIAVTDGIGQIYNTIYMQIPSNHADIIADTNDGQANVDWYQKVRSFVKNTINERDKIRQDIDFVKGEIDLIEVDKDGILIYFKLNNKYASALAAPNANDPNFVSLTEDIDNTIEQSKELVNDVRAKLVEMYPLTDDLMSACEFVRNNIESDHDLGHQTKGEQMVLILPRLIDIKFKIDDAINTVKEKLSDLQNRRMKIDNSIDALPSPDQAAPVDANAQVDTSHSDHSPLKPASSIHILATGFLVLSMFAIN